MALTFVPALKIRNTYPSCLVRNTRSPLFACFFRAVLILTMCSSRMATEAVDREAMTVMT